MRITVLLSKSQNLATYFRLRETAYVNDGS